MIHSQHIKFKTNQDCLGTNLYTTKLEIQELRKIWDVQNIRETSL